jgi:hypothetical protein
MFELEWPMLEWGSPVSGLEKNLFKFETPMSGLDMLLFGFETPMFELERLMFGFEMPMFGIIIGMFQLQVADFQSFAISCVVIMNPSNPSRSLRPLRLTSLITPEPKRIPRKAVKPQWFSKRPHGPQARA